MVPAALSVVLVGGGLIVGVVGFLDDRYQLSAGIRLAAHFGAALWALVWLGGLPSVHVANHSVSLGWLGYVLGTLGIVWYLNLFNFMDGIDGIAVSEAIYVASGGALLEILAGGSPGVAATASVLAAACCGFLVWNWPPAKIFMGDVGSGYLGYVLAVMAIAATHENPSAIWTWLILGGVFIVDATVTLVRRLIRGEPVCQAHRSHAYQWLARRWQSHLRVTLLVIVINVAWLLPCAVLATRFSDLAIWIAALALFPLIALAIAAGSGNTESRAIERSHSER
jgi:Fuc2NAc and GlcNAc transferase